MAYKIAVASSDGIEVNETFGNAARFLIFTVNNETIEPPEERICTVGDESDISSVCNDNTCRGNGSRCNNYTGNAIKVGQIADCRCVVCQKIGFQVQKQLERKAISFFDVSRTVEEALSKIIKYYSRIDKHESLRK